MAELEMFLGGQAESQSSEIGPQLREEDGLATMVRKSLQSARKSVEKWRGQAKEAKRNYDGHQWDARDKAANDSLKRPSLTLNEIKPIVNAVSGIERLNRQEVRFVSRALDSTMEEDVAGELSTEAVIAVLELCSGNEERSRSVKDLLITGMGFTEVVTEYVYSSDPDGRIQLNWVNPQEMMWDPDAVKENLEDASWIAREREFPNKTIKERWPEKYDQVMSRAADATMANVDKYELVTPYYSLENEKANPLVGPQSGGKKTTRVTQYQWRELVPMYRFVNSQDPEGPLTSLREDDWNRLVSRLEKLGKTPPPAVRQLTPIYQQVYIANGLVLDTDEKPVTLPKGFSLLCMTGLWDDEDKVWYGMVRDMLDAQRTMNKAMSSALTFHITNAKGGTMFETDAFVDPEMAKAQWSRPDAWIELQPGGAQKVHPRVPSQISPELAIFFQTGRESLGRVSGVNEEVVGLSQGETSSPTQSRRIQSGLAVLGWFFDNVGRYRRMEARTLLEFIREYWSHGQLIQVGGDFSSHAVPLLRDKLPLDYELVLDDSVRHNPNLKAQVWQDLQGIMPALLRYGFGKFLLYALKFSPLPTQLVQMLQKEAMQSGDPSQQKKGRGKDVSPEERDAKIQKMHAEAAKIQAQANQIHNESGFKAAKIMLDGLSEAHHHRHQTELEKHRSLADLIKAVRASHMGGGLG